MTVIRLASLRRKASAPARASLLFALGVALAASPAHAQSAKPTPPSPTERLVLRLDYSGAPGCSDSESFRISLINKISDWDPIDDKGRWRLVVSVKRRGAGFDGSAEVYDPQDAIVWSTLMPPPQPPPKPPLSPLPCHTLIDSLAVVLAIWMDPPEGFPKPPTHAPICAPAPTSAGPSRCEDMTETALLLKPPPSEPTPPSPKPLSFQLATVTSIGRVTTSRADIGISLDLGIRYRLFQAEIEARGDPPLTSTPLSGGSANYARGAGALLLCTHYLWLVACAKTEAARLFALGNVTDVPRIYGAVGMRLALDYPIPVPSQRFNVYVRVSGEVLAPINPPTITKTNGQTPLFQVQQDNESVGFGGVVSFDAL